MLYVFTKSYTKNDIENFINVFDIMGDSVSADEKVEDFIKMFYNCKKKRKLQRNNLLIEQGKISFL